MTQRENKTRDKVLDAYQRHGGKIGRVAKELGLARSTIHGHLDRAGITRPARPLAGGSQSGVSTHAQSLPPSGKIHRYILTSAQNNTHVHAAVWRNLLVLAEHYDAKILVGTFSYNQNEYGPLSVKRGKSKPKEKQLWYDPAVTPFITDERWQLAPGLLWCGEMNCIPTADDPLSGLETYSGRASAVFPHAKIAMRSIAALSGSGVKLNFTTGTVTQMNYVQKKAGLKAEHHHTYGAVLVEVDSHGHWWVRQIDADQRTGDIQDLRVAVSDGKIDDNAPIEAITWGDLHATCIDPVVHTASIDMLKTLQPKVQFIHDLLEGASVNHHNDRNPHARFQTYLRGYSSVDQELRDTADILATYTDHAPTVIVDSNHDNWLVRWLRESDYRSDPQNAILFLRAQLECYEHMEAGKPFNMTEWAMRYVGGPVEKVRFLATDESYRICNGRIECGMHGHLGPDGRRGSPAALARVGRRATTAHTHSAGIIHGLYTAGTSTKLDMGYNHGPSSWSHSHVVTYPSGKRSIVTIYSGKWRA